MKIKQMSQGGKAQTCSTSLLLLIPHSKSCHSSIHFLQQLQYWICHTALCYSWILVLVVSFDHIVLHKHRISGRISLLSGFSTINILTAQVIQSTIPGYQSIVVKSRHPRWSYLLHRFVPRTAVRSSSTPRASENLH